MRIITGTLKGRQIRIPKDVEIRPTTDRAKESIFNRIEARYFLDGVHILDLFAGSGNMGFEAISRGVEKVVAVESNPRHTELMLKNAENLGVENQIRIITTDVLTYLEGNPVPFHFIFCDPPYQYPFFDELIEKVLSQNWLTEEGWFILEHDKSRFFDDHPNCTFTKKYGRTVVSIFQKYPKNTD